MGAPWEKYQQQSISEEGPWKKYSTSEIPGPRRATVSDIPVEPGANTTTTPVPEVGLLDRLKAGVEASAGLVSGAVAAPVGMLADLVGGAAQVAGGGKMVPTPASAGPSPGTQLTKALTYQPRSQTGQEYLRQTGNFLANLGLEGIPIPIANQLAAAAPGAAGAVRAAVANEANLATQIPRQYLARQAEQKAAQQSAQSWARAPQIEAAQAAQRNGIALNPAVSNPTKRNQFGQIVSGGDADVNARLSKANEGKWADLAREDMGLPSNTVLDASAFDLARAQVSAPYDNIRQIGPMTDWTGDIMKSMERIKISDSIAGGERAMNQVNNMVDRALYRVEKGIPGYQIVDEIRQLRRDAQSIYHQQKQKTVAPSPEQSAIADANMKMADALENLIESNLKTPDAVNEFRQARTSMAKIYDYERATDVLTGKVDPLAIAKMAREGKPLTGTMADIANIAGNFPDIAQVGAEGSRTLRRFTRAGIGGTLGFAAGTAVGQPFAGSAIGAGLGQVLSEVNARRMATPGFQAARAIPQDLRMYPPQAQTPMPPAKSPNAIVPYDWTNALLTPEQVPDWRYWNPRFSRAAGGVAPEDIKHGIEPYSGPAQLPAPSAESTMATVANQRAAEYAAAKRADEASQRRAAFVSEVERQPTRGGQVYELDPTTGRLRPVDQGLKGATPDTLTSTGHSLASASEKVASGQRVAMSAEERIAWNKTRVDLDMVDPGFTKLSDEAIAAKMQDRQWVNDTVKKAKAQTQELARQEALLRDQLANRNNLRMMGQEISAKNAQLEEIVADRRRLVAFAEQLDDQLRTPSGSVKLGQGPKTLEARRNQLAPKNRNALTEQQ